MSIENLLDELRNRVVENHDARLVEDLVCAITEFVSCESGGETLISKFDDISFAKLVESVSDDIANTLVRHGEDRINAALKDMLPSGLVMVATIAQLALT